MRTRIPVLCVAPAGRWKWKIYLRGFPEDGLTIWTKWRAKREARRMARWVAPALVLIYDQGNIFGSAEIVEGDGTVITANSIETNRPVSRRHRRQ